MERGLVEVGLESDVLSVRLLNRAAALRSVCLQDSPEVSLCLALPDTDLNVENRSYIGVTAGPVANRIGGASFELDGRRFHLEANEGSSQLHGGATGFDRKLWSVDAEQAPARVRFHLHRPDGEGGYPGNLDVVVTYELEGNRLRYRWTATTDRLTPVSLTNHAYWNLAGSGDIRRHRLQVAASKLVVVDDAAIPTGDLAPVAGTAFDLRRPLSLGSAVDQLGEGIDHCYVLDRHDDPDAGSQISLSDSDSGRSLDITTSLPGVQVYTGQFLDGAPESGGFPKYAGVCLETQHLPDAVNQPSFPSCLVEPGRPVTHTTDYIFNR